MNMLMSVDWNALFVPQGSLIEIVIRGTAIFFFIFILMRFVIKKKMGSISLSDLIVVVIIADAAQNGMAGEYKSVTEGFLLIGTIMFWDYIFDLLSFHFKTLGKVFHPDPIKVVDDGKMIAVTMRKELLSERELMSKMRENEISNLDQVKAAYIEGDGQISFLKA